MIIKSLEFVKSASKLAECPAPDFAEIAVIGRSNVGKSTLINLSQNLVINLVKLSLLIIFW